MKTNPHFLPVLFAYEDTEDLQKRSGFTGVKALHDVERDASNGRPIATHLEDHLVFHFTAKMTPAQIRTNDILGFYDQNASATQVSNTKLKPALFGDQIASIATVKVFFVRPIRGEPDFTGIDLQRGDAHKEVASLYNPYW